MAFSERSNGMFVPRPLFAMNTGLLGCLLGVAAGCAELAPGSDTLEAATGPSLPDAAAAAVDSSWACLDEPPEPSAVALRPEAVLTLRVIDAGLQAPPAGLIARACRRLDVDCLTPVGTSVVVAADGGLHLPVEQGFDGFVEITSPTSVPTMFFLNGPMLTNREEAFQIISLLGIQALADGDNVVLDPALGQLLIRAFDCEGAPASGIELSNDKGGEPFSFVEGLPVSGLTATTADGFGGFVNVPLGLTVLQGRRLEGGRVSGTASVFVRRGWFTYGDVEPLPQ